MTGGYTTRVLRSVPELEQIRPLWQQWQNHPNSDIDFYLMVLRNRPNIVRPHVMVIEREGTPQSLLIGRIERTKIELNLGYARLLNPIVRQLSIIHAGALGDFSEECCQVALEEVQTELQSGAIDVAMCSYWRLDSPFYEDLRGVPITARDHVPVSQPHRRMTLPPTVDEFYGRLSAKVRKNLRWQAKKLVTEIGGEVQTRCFRTPAEIGQMFDQVEQVAQKTYQRGLGVGFDASAAMRQRMQFEAEKGWLRAYVLTVGTRPCAFWIGSQYGDDFHSNFMGYDPAYAKYSPGMFLVVRVIEEVIASPTGIRRVDFGLGDAQYKEVLSDEVWQEGLLYVFAPTFRGLSLNAIRTPVLWADKAVRRALKKTQLLLRIKKMWRATARKGAATKAAADVSREQ